MKGNEASFATAIILSCRSCLPTSIKLPDMDHGGTDLCLIMHSYSTSGTRSALTAITARSILLGYIKNIPLNGWPFTVPPLALTVDLHRVSMQILVEYLILGDGRCSRIPQIPPCS